MCIWSAFGLPPDLLEGVACPHQHSVPGMCAISACCVRDGWEDGMSLADEIIKMVSNHYSRDLWLLSLGAHREDMSGSKEAQGLQTHQKQEWLLTQQDLRTTRQEVFLIEVVALRVPQDIKKDLRWDSVYYSKLTHPGKVNLKSNSQRYCWRTEWGHSL